MSSTREQIIQTTADLMEKQGYHATGLNEIVRESGAPKGSVYYYFPDGKEQIASEAILLAGQVVSERIRTGLEKQPEPAQAIRDFLYQVADRVEASNFSAGSPLTSVAMETAVQSKRINQACQEAYEMLKKSFREKLLTGKMDETKASHLAEFITAAAEGGIILSRTNQTADPLRRVADQIYRILDDAFKQ
jgi:TetR/AcrR family transcriptional regulator, lmrAB and yxaGH operons repressor